MSKKLTRSEIVEVAKAYNLDPSTLVAVKQVESGGSGFLPDGRLKILFEGHYMWKRLKARGINPIKLHLARPSLVFSKWTKRFYRGQEGEWDRINEILAWAEKNAPNQFESYKKAAYESCSWGMFQIMGTHYQTLGFDNVYDFKHAMETGESKQLDLIVQWMNTKVVEWRKVRYRLLTLLRERVWDAFAYGYNGSGYRKNNYDVKLREAYETDKKNHR